MRIARHAALAIVFALALAASSAGAALATDSVKTVTLYSSPTTKHMHCQHWYHENDSTHWYTTAFGYTINGLGSEQSTVKIYLEGVNGVVWQGQWSGQDSNTSYWRQVDKVTGKGSASHHTWSNWLWDPANSDGDGGRIDLPY
jgi:hypothetical protein